MEKIKTEDSIDANIYVIRSAKPTRNYLFVFHEWWGLNDYMKRESDDLQKALGDVNVIALDLYDGKIAQDAKTAGEYVQQMKSERGVAIINAAVKYVGSDAKIATIGWCFGGSWSLESTFLEGKQAVGCVIYYGMPEKDIARLKTLQCNVLGIFGTLDSYVTPKVVEEFQKNMKAANKTLEVHNYKAVHAFANPSNPKYDKEKSEDAHKHAVAFLKKSFGL